MEVFGEPWASYPINWTSRTHLYVVASMTTNASAPSADRSIGDRAAQAPYTDADSHMSYGILLVAFTVVICAIVSGAFRWDAPLFASALVPATSLVGACWLARAGGMGRWFAVVEMYFVLMTTTFLMAFVAVVAASSAFPLIDAQLRSADLLVFGFDRDVFVGTATEFPTLMAASRWVYMSLGWTPPLLLVALVFGHREDRAWALLTALLLTMVICIASLAVFPAYGTPPYAYRFLDIFEGVRTGTMRRFDDTIITGLVTFPSMHAAYGVILARAAILAGRWYWPIAALNLLMIGSALLVGGHYLTDIVAGCAVAWAAIRLAGLR